MRSYSIERCCSHSVLARELGPQSVVIDLGVNRGEFATWIVQRFGCSVYGAEPDPGLYTQLTQNDKLQVFPVAVGGQNGSATLNRVQGRCATLVDGVLGPQDRTEVKLVTLETLFSLCGLLERDRIEVVKVDIEGAELPMFDYTSDNILRRVAQFTVEFHNFIWPEMTEHVNRIKSRLRSLGFRVITFSRNDDDVLFLNQELLGIGATGDIYLRGLKYRDGISRATKRLLGRLGRLVRC
jgi:FkbM family methyltransferase